MDKQRILTALKEKAPLLSVRQTWVEWIINGAEVVDTKKANYVGHTCFDGERVYKDIENRSRFAYKHRGSLFIHAAKTLDMEGNELYTYCKSRGFIVPDTNVLQRGGIIGMVNLDNVSYASDSIWAIKGQTYLNLSEPIALPFYPTSGQLGLFQSIGMQDFYKAWLSWQASPTPDKLQGEFYTFGYNRFGDEKEQLMLNLADKVLIDCRYGTGGKKWNDRDLAQLYPRYKRIAWFGNINYMKGDIKIYNYAIGKRQLNGYLSYYKKPVILMCACKRYETCHRAVLSDMLQKDGMTYMGEFE